MKFYSQKIVAAARTLRRQGKSAETIAKKLNVSEQTILRWCHDILPRNPRYRHQEKARYQAQVRGQSAVQTFVLNKTTAKLLTALLYWCEGSRYPAANCVVFTNSDPELVRTFMRLFRAGFNPVESKFRAHLQLHTTHNVHRIYNFWSQLLGIPTGQFYKPTVTTPGSKMKRRDYFGTCSVRYYDFQIFHQILGAQEAFRTRLKMLRSK